MMERRYKTLGELADAAPECRLRIVDHYLESPYCEIAGVSSPNWNAAAIKVADRYGHPYTAAVVLMGGGFCEDAGGAWRLCSGECCG